MIFTMLCYASAVYAVIVHLFVLSQAGIVLKQQGELYWFLA